jgi:hypothetical protein
LKADSRSDIVIRDKPKKNKNNICRSNLRRIKKLIIYYPSRKRFSMIRLLSKKPLEVLRRLR